MNPTITVAVQCHNFQRRLCWLLSSIADQSAVESVVVDVAFLKGNGTPETEDVLGYFWEHGVQSKPSVWTDYEAFCRRGNVRTRQLQECRTEWIMFTDADHVFGPEHFWTLASELQKHQNARYLIGAGRLSTDVDKANALVDRHVNQAPSRVERAFDKARAIAQERVRGAIGAGNSQIVSVPYGAHGGLYVDPARNPDRGWSHGKGQNTRSDVAFRRRMSAGGGLHKLPAWFDSQVVHLSHDRDKDAGRHVSAQR